MIENVALNYDDLIVGRSCWIHEYNMDRPLRGEYSNVYRQARMYEDKFYEYLRMTIQTFDCLLSTLEHRLTKITTKFRQPLTPEERLVITLR